MKYCKNCNVYIRTPQKRCPLCQGELQGSSDPENKPEQIFPDFSRSVYRGILWYRIFSFLCLTTGMIFLITDWLCNKAFGWSLYCVAAVGTIWILTTVGFLKRRNLLKIAVWEFGLLSLLAILWDVLTGWNGWSLDFALPVLAIICLVIMLVLCGILRIRISYGMIYFLMGSAAGIFPLLLYWIGILEKGNWAVLSGGFSSLVIAALVIFRWNDVRTEMEKTFHI